MSVQELRAKTGVGIVECSKALKDTNGDVEKAVILLRERGIAKADSYTNRTTKAGTIGFYLHHDGTIGAMVALACETDFVSRMPEFKELANDLAMHAIGTSSVYPNRENVPKELVEVEESLARKEFLSKGMNEDKIAKILPGKMSKFYERVVLLDQNHFVKTTQKLSDIVKEFSSKVKEKVGVVSLAITKV